MSQTPEFEQWLSSVRNVGTQMANTLYNISHRGTVVISGDEAEAMIKMVAAWDAIRQSPPATDLVMGSRTAELEAALKLAIEHIEHMAAWISNLKSGYSFEGLGEDMPGMKAALSPSSNNSSEG